MAYYSKGALFHLLLLAVSPGQGASLKLQTYGGLQQLGGAASESDIEAELRTAPAKKPRNSTKQLLTVCNAYAYSKPFHVYNMRSQQRLTGKDPLNYRECGDYTVWLREGDQLDFRTSVPGNPEHDLKEQEAGEHSVGVFRAWGLPKQTSSLLLVPHRQGTSMTVAFESHIYRELQNSQLAVVDAYLGENYGRMRITDEQDIPLGNDGRASFMNNRGRSEELNYNSVIALNPGTYRLILSNSTGEDISAVSFQVGKAKQKFLVMRLGVDDDVHYKVGNATELPQELFLHQQNLEDTHSASMGLQPLLASFLVTAFAIALQR